MPKPSVALCKREADDQDERERDLVRSCGLADRKPLAEVVQSDPGRDQERKPPAGRQAFEPRARGELVDRRRTRPDERRGALAGHPAVVVDEAHQADGQAPGE